MQCQEVLSTQYYKLSPPITACVFSATQALSHLFKRWVNSVTERSYPKSHTELGIRTHQVALWQCKAWYLLTSQWEASTKKKKLKITYCHLRHFPLPHICSGHCILAPGPQTMRNGRLPARLLWLCSSFQAIVPDSIFCLGLGRQKDREC